MDWSELFANAGLTFDGGELVSEVAVHGEATAPAASERERGRGAHILEEHRQRGVRGDCAERDTNTAGGALPACATGHLVDAGRRESGHGGEQDDGRNDLAEGGAHGGRTHRERGDQ